MNQDCSSLGRRISLTTRSLVPWSPALSAASEMSRQLWMMILWASRRREIWTGTSSLPRGGRANAGGLGYVAAHGDGDAAEELDALGDGVDHLDLLVEVLVEEKMKLVEGGAGDLPVVFLVHVAQGDGIGEELVELGDHVGADLGIERMRHVLDDRAVLLDLLRVRVPVGRYVRDRLRSFLDCNCHHHTSFEFSSFYEMPEVDESVSRSVNCAI